MKIGNVLILLALVSCSLSEGHDQASIVPLSQVDQQAEPFVILELFTSEGCSDCPTAEVWLNEITDKAMADKSYIYPLAFHVDYWNKLGWRDVFSDAAYSNRQRRYREAFGNEVVYTPQLIANGTSEFVGSDRSKTTEEMEKALREIPPVYFSMEPDEEWKSLHYEIIDTSIESEELVADYEFNVAIVERGLVTQVSRGENKNRTLEHENVVRHFQTHPLSQDAKIDITYSPGELNKNHSIIAFVQHKKTMQIVGANLWNY